jgi:hypothetical protein
MVLQLPTTAVLSRGWCGLPNALPGANYLPSRTHTAPDVTGRPKEIIKDSTGASKLVNKTLKNSFYLKAIRPLNSHR